MRGEMVVWWFKVVQKRRRRPDDIDGLWWRLFSSKHCAVLFIQKKVEKGGFVLLVVGWLVGNK